MWILKPPESRFFSDEELRAVQALLEGILPATDTAPGAVDAGAAEFLDRLLAMDGSTYYEIPKWQQSYREALLALDAAAKSGYGGKAVADLSADERRDLLTKLAAGTLEGASFDQKTFFAMLRNHCIEGCFSDPRWGGNKDAAMWRWYGYLEPARELRRPTKAQ